MIVFAPQNACSFHDGTNHVPGIITAVIIINHDLVMYQVAYWAEGGRVDVLLEESLINFDDKCDTVAIGPHDTKE